jgi:hypothetical protein
MKNITDVIFQKLKTFHAETGFDHGSLREIYREKSKCDLESV